MSRDYPRPGAATRMHRPAVTERQQVGRHLKPTHVKGNELPGLRACLGRRSSVRCSQTLSLGLT